MELTAYDINNSYAVVELGTMVEPIQPVKNLKRDQDRDLQVSKPINAGFPNIFDRAQTMDSFGFQVSQSFPTVGEANLNWLTWPDDVPRLAHVSFKQGGEIVWVPFAGIKKVTLVLKDSCLVIWEYTVIGGGATTEKKPF